MEIDHAFSTIDTHTAGEPTRIVTDGITFSPGTKTTSEYRAEFVEEFDWIRELLIKEPRGHDDMFGAIPVRTSKSGADLGLFFLTNEGYLDMCGHATIGVITAFIERGRLPAEETIVVDTPAGLVEASPTVDGGTVEQVQFRNVESYFYDTCSIELDGHRLGVDIVYAGNFFAMVDSEDIDSTVSKSETRQLIELAADIEDRVNEAMNIRHPVTDEPSAVTITEFYERTQDGDRNMTVFGNGSVDRSPCGTGTCAKMALLHAKDELAVGEAYAHESVIGTKFEGEIEAVRRQNGYDGITPLVRGSAYIIARNEYSLDPHDPIIGFNVASADD